PESSWPIKPLSDALMIAALLGLTVDWFLKRALIRDVGSIFIGWSLPQEVRNYIREVSQTSIVRKNWRTHYHFTMSDSKDSVTVKVTSYVEIFNFSTAFREYRPSLALDLRDRPDEQAISCEVKRGRKTHFKGAEGLNNPKLVKKEADIVTWTF